MADAWMEQRSLTYSFLLHVGLFLVAAFGLPAILPKEPEPEPTVMTVDILPIAPITNVKPSDQPLQKAQEAPVPPTKTPLPKPMVEPPKVQEKSESFDPTKDAEPKPEEKEKPKEEPKFEDVLKNLAKESDQQPVKAAKDKTTAKEVATRSDAPYDQSLPLSLSEKDAIKNQFIKCWHMPAGAKDPHSLAVRLHVQLKEDGGLLSVELSPDQLGRYNSDSYFRAAADSAKRAVAECTQPPNGPLKDLPADKYGSWRDMDLNFDPSALLY